ncbi:proline dehydrogenase family protein [Membranicola marinus]|uniref:Proline dehydrogenase family protein n=1 Tax=Membranihabitans marinus TaxID=1227546 RepID=A0A953LCN1_9BACT|nr:proline dehydrogenase family protein [Membranihabitans marinus]MBY5959681.1 proline dehydrogenase family protein [Membranihabitans marinus]
MNKDEEQRVNFENTEVAFAYKSTAQLRLALWLFRLMSRSFWSHIFIKMGAWALKFRLPLAPYLIKETVYQQFIGGVSLEDTEPLIDNLSNHHCLVVLDYAVEGKHEEEELDGARDQFIQTIHFAANQPTVPVITIKVSALAQNKTLQAWAETGLRNSDFDEKWDRVVQRLIEICDHAAEYGMKIFIDAEESWHQDAIDFLANEMMKRYNQDEVVVYNTYQMYRHDRLDFLKQSYRRAQEEEYIFGAKLVRGAYMEKERARAKRKNYPSPISANKKVVDRDFNEGILFCAEHYENIALCAATHNLISCKILADFIEELPARRDHPHLNFCQLYGMGDDITFNLGAHGYNVAKYVPYGPVKEAFPYLIRRAEENKAMSNEFNREYKLIRRELERRKNS